jgi:hypothetical protein
MKIESVYTASVTYALLSARMLRGGIGGCKSPGGAKSATISTAQKKDRELVIFLLTSDSGCTIVGSQGSRWAAAKTDGEQQ